MRPAAVRFAAEDAILTNRDDARAALKFEEGARTGGGGSILVPACGSDDFGAFASRQCREWRQQPHPREAF
jgi:hypothetical protein